MAISRTLFGSGFQMVKKWPTIQKPDNLSSFRMAKMKWQPKHSKTGQIRPVFQCKMAAKAFETRTQNVSGKWPFENLTVRIWDVDCMNVIYLKIPETFPSPAESVD
jgi:hypothetical protein